MTFGETTALTVREPEVSSRVSDSGGLKLELAQIDSKTHGSDPLWVRGLGLWDLSGQKL